MSPAGGCGAVADLLPELALGIVGGTERADVLSHLNRCASCRDTTASFAATVDALPVLLGEAEPPAGFEARTLERLRTERDRVPRPSLLKRVLAVAAIVAAVMIVSIAAVRIIDARDTTSTEVASNASVSPMISPNRHEAGHAVMGSDGERYLWLNVDYGDGDDTYRLETVDASHHVTQAGTVSLRDGLGSWGGEIKGPKPTIVRLVGQDGEVFCVAYFGPA